MSVEKPVSLGIAGNEVSKKITGSSEVSAGQSAIATGAGATLGAVASDTLIVTGITTAPVTVLIDIASGAISLLASMFD